MRQESLIELRDFHHTYLEGTPKAGEAVRGVSLRIERGERVAVVGPTRSGKSTLVDSLAALLRLGRGQVFYEGEDVAAAGYDRARLRREVGVVFQSPEAQIVEDIVGADVAFGPTAAGLSAPETRRRVQESLDAVGLPHEEYRLRYTHALSGGQRRRVAIAGVLAMRPRVLVLDEPMAGLDPEGRAGVVELLRSLLEDPGLTLVFCSTSLREASLLCRRVVVLDGGESVLDAPLEEALRNSAMLDDLDITLPETIALARKLREVYPDFPEGFLTEDELEEEISRRVGRVGI